jgi:hypothetical protein
LETDFRTALVINAVAIASMYPLPISIWMKSKKSLSINLKTKKVSNVFMTMSKYVLPIDLANELVLGNASFPMKIMVIKIEAAAATMDSAI